MGDLDPITPVAAAQEIIEALPEGIGQLEIIEGAGHFTWKDAPGRYWDPLCEFVQKVWRRPAGSRLLGTLTEMNIYAHD